MIRRENINLSLKQIIEKQPTTNIGTIGSVSHGKSTTIHRISGTKTQRTQKEIEHQATIRLGYANVKLYQCPKSGEIIPLSNSSKAPISQETGEPMNLIKNLSFVDCPGHEAYMATMMNGTAVMDTAILIVAANDTVFPQDQTTEHLTAISNTDIENIICLQNKLDLVRKDDAIKHHYKLRKYLDEFPRTKCVNIIPVSAQRNQNIDSVYNYLAYQVKEPNRDYNKKPRMTVIRTFDINHPDTPIKMIKGGVVGGTIRHGVFEIGDIVEIRPGIYMKNDKGQIFCSPLITKIESLKSEDTNLERAVAGGLIGVGLSIDPFFTHSDHLIGQTVGLIGHVPKIYKQITVKYKHIGMIETLNKLNSSEPVRIIVNSINIEAFKVDIEENNDDKKSKNKNKKQNDEKKSKTLTFNLEKPVALDDGEILTIMRKYQGRYRVYYSCLFVEGQEVDGLELPDNYKELVNGNIERNYTIINDLQPLFEKDQDNLYNYNLLLKKITFLNQDNETFEVEPPISKRCGKKTIFANFPQVVQSINRQTYMIISRQMVDNDPIKIGLGQLQERLNMENHLKEYIEKELKKQINFNEDRQLIIAGSFNDGNIEILLSTYLNKYVRCRQCQSMLTILGKHNRQEANLCLKCYNINLISNLQNKMK